MADDDFNIDDIQLTRFSPQTPQKVQTGEMQSPRIDPRIEIIEDGDEDPEENSSITPVMPQCESVNYTRSKNVETQLVLPELKVILQQNDPAENGAGGKKTAEKKVGKKAVPPAGKKNQIKAAPQNYNKIDTPSVKKRNYAAGCCVFAFVVPLLIGAGAAAAVRYWEPIRMLMEKFDVWMAEHGLSYDGEDAPWKHKKEGESKLKKISRKVSSSADDGAEKTP